MSSSAPSKKRNRPKFKNDNGDKENEPPIKRSKDDIIVANQKKDIDNIIAKWQTFIESCEFNVYNTASIWPLLSASISSSGYGALKGVVSLLVRKIATIYADDLSDDSVSTFSGTLFDYFGMIEVLWNKVNSSNVLKQMILNSPLAQSEGVNEDVASVISSYVDKAFILDVVNMLFDETTRFLKATDNRWAVSPEDAIPAFNAMSFYLYFVMSPVDKDTEEKCKVIAGHLTDGDWTREEMKEFNEGLTDSLRQAYTLDFANNPKITVWKIFPCSE